MFADTATIEIRAGKGGDGRLSFRHEKYRAKGGPDGGNGGRGGDIIFQVDHNANTLSTYRTTRLITAEDGQMGGTNRKNGKHGESVTVKVPLGTQIFEGDTLLADLAENGATAIIAKGGRGGFGNAHFVSSVRQAPRAAELGEQGDYKKLRLELKLVADVGLVGLPNAGKSTLLSVITNAKPEIADYPFTTLVPNLGVVDHRDNSFVVADIPGLIEGASEGKGLGDEFLRHVERTAVLLHLVSAQSDDVAGDYRTIQEELKKYPADLSAKPQLVVLSKADEVLPDEAQEQQAALREASGQDVFVISAHAHQGLGPVLDEALKLVQAERKRRAAAAEEAEVPVIELADLPSAWHVAPEDDGAWRISGDRIEGFARRTDMQNEDSVARLRNILTRTGVDRELRRQGAEPGEIIRVADRELEWLG